MKKMMNSWDKILIIGLLTFALIGLIVIQLKSGLFPDREKSKLVLHIEIDSKEVDRFKLSDLKPGRKLNYDTKFGHNVVEILEDGVRVYEADCPDQLCVHQGKISKAGEIIVCLPHRLLVSLSGEDGNEKGIDAQTR